MASRPCGTALVVLLGVLVVGCGADPERPSPTDATRRTRPRPPRRPTSIGSSCRPTSCPAWTPVSSPFTDTGRPFDLPEARGRGARTQSATSRRRTRPAEGAHGAGVSSVLLFETEAGARDWMAYENSDEALHHQLPDSTITRFEVPEIPGATGWTGPDLHGNAIGTVYWTQGRCMLIISIETKGPRVRPLSAGAQGHLRRARAAPAPTDVRHPLVYRARSAPAPGSAARRTRCPPGRPARSTTRRRSARRRRGSRRGRAAGLDLVVVRAVDGGEVEVHPVLDHLPLADRRQDDRRHDRSGANGLGVARRPR